MPRVTKTVVGNRNISYCDKRSVMIRQEICPIRAEISTHKHGEKLYISYLYDSRYWFQTILPNFGDFGAKMSFFHYIINQKRNNFIKHCSPPCTKKPLISEMCIYIKSSMCKWGLGTLGGTMFYRQKTKGGVGLKHTKYVIANGKLRQSSTFW